MLVSRGATMVKHERFTVLSLSLFFLINLHISTAQAQTIRYVNRTDPTCGGHTLCYTTIQAAVNAAGPGNIVRIQSGIYTEQVRVSNKNRIASSTEMHRIVIESDPNSPVGSVIVRGTGGGGGDDDSGCGDDDGPSYGIRLRNSRYITIRDLIITNVAGPAIWLAPSGDGDDTDGGGKVNNVAIHIELNRIYGNVSSTCNGAVVVSAGNRETLIVNNLIYANGLNGIAFEGSGSGPHYVINNTVYGNRRNGINVARGQTVLLANNIVNGNGTASGTTGGRFGVRRESSSTPQPQNIRLLNNLVCGNTQGQISTQLLDATDSGNFTPTGSEGAGVGALPGCQLPANLFANKNGHDKRANTVDDDFSLKPNSLAIDAGMDPRTLGFNPSFNPIFEADFAVEGIRPADGNANRVPAFDAGAFEFSNAPPVADAGAIETVPTGEIVTLNGTQSSDPEGAPLGFLWTIVSQAAGSNITLTGANTANPTFTPLVIGDYILRLVVNDGQFNSAPATVTVTAINHPPTANNISATTNEDTPVIVSLSAIDLDDATLSFNVVAAPSNGTLNANSGTLTCSSGNCTGSVTYTPAANFNGADSFTFAVTDGLATSNVTTASISVGSVADAPTANGATVSTDEDVPVAITLAASDVDSASLSFSFVAAPTNGTLGAVSSPNCVASGAGSNCTATVTYTPVANYNGPDNFTFKANDDPLDSTVVTVSLTVLPVNDAPVASNGTAQTNEDNPIVITLSAIDIDSTGLMFNIVTGLSNGSLSAIGAPHVPLCPITPALQEPSAPPRSRTPPAPTPVVRIVLHSGSTTALWIPMLRRFPSSSTLSTMPRWPAPISTIPMRLRCSARARPESWATTMISIRRPRT